MKKSFMTNMPDKSGAFLQAAQIILRHGGNITRANYNKAIDIHTLFVDVEAEPEALLAIETELTDAGFLYVSGSPAKIVLLEAEVPDRPGALVPLLEVVNRYQINISYMSTQVSPAASRQSYKMGLYIEEPGMVSTLLEELSTLCPVRILQYDAGEKSLDNTVFYLNFAAEMRRLLHLTQEETNDFIYYSNLVMQQLDERNEPPSKTFEYINKFAKFVVEHGGDGYDCRLSWQQISPRVAMTLIEPPSGSNIIILEDQPGGPLLVIDGGYRCHSRFALRLLRQLFEDFDNRPKEMFLTHADADHIGVATEFGVIHCSRRTADCFEAELRGEAVARELNRNSLPYYRLCKLITQYQPPMLSQLRVVDTIPCDDTQPLSPIGVFDFADLHFDVWQGNGGHVPGETVLIDEERRIAVTGDDYINARGCTAPQKEYNRLAPYLMTSVNENSPKARAILRHLIDRFNGKGWLIIPSHGAVVERNQSM